MTEADVPSIKNETILEEQNSKPARLVQTIEPEYEEYYETSKLSRYVSEQMTTPLSQICLCQNENEDPDEQKLSLIDEISLEDSSPRSTGKFID